MNTKDGGPAFPVFPESSVGHSAAFRGMSLRDWFAGQALSTLLIETNRDEPTDEIAFWAYEIADAMLKAREET